MITVRKATSEDVGVLQKLASELVPSSFKGVLTTAQIDFMLDKLYSQQALSDAIGAGTDYFIATYNGEDLGVVSVIQQGPNLFLMQKIYVNEHFIGKGIGTALFTKVKEYVRSKILPCTIELIINAHNPGLDFYKNQGMQKVRDTGLDMGDFFINEEVYSLELN